MAFENLFVKALHVLCSERRLEGNGLIDDAAQRPDVRFVIVRLVSPHLGTRVVRRACLSVEQSLLGDLADIHVAQFGCSVLAEENVSGFQVAVEDVDVVKSLETSDNLDEDAPDLVFGYVMLVLGALSYFLKQVSVIHVFHDDAANHKPSRRNSIYLPQTALFFVDEGFLVGADVRVLNTGQNADLVQCVLFFLLRQSTHVDFFEGVDGVVSQPPYLVHARVGSFT